MKLSIIIPYFNTFNLTSILLDNLCNQLTPEVEVILVDDGCNEFLLDTYPIQVIHLLQNKGLSNARNIGIDNAKGRFIAFIDSDDNVSINYIDKIIETINTKEFDYCFFSWEASDGQKYIIKDMPGKENNSVWNCIYKKEIIGHFKTGYQVIEDKDFNEKYRKGKKENIEDILYYYYQNPNGISARFDKGEIEVEEQWHKKL